MFIEPSLYVMVLGQNKGTLTTKTLCGSSFMGFSCSQINYEYGSLMNNPQNGFFENHSKDNGPYLSIISKYRALL